MCSSFEDYPPPHTHTQWCYKQNSSSSLRVLGRQNHRTKLGLVWPQQTKLKERGASKCSKWKQRSKKGRDKLIENVLTRYHHVCPVFLPSGILGVTPALIPEFPSLPPKWILEAAGLSPHTTVVILVSALWQQILWGSACVWLFSPQLDCYSQHLSYTFIIPHT